MAIKTNSIIRYSNPVCQDYRKHRRKAELGSDTGSNKHENKQPQLTETADNNQTSGTETYRDKHMCEDRLSVHKMTDHWRNRRHTGTTQNLISQTTANSEVDCRGLTQFTILSLLSVSCYLIYIMLFYKVPAYLVQMKHCSLKDRTR